MSSTPLQTIITGDVVARRWHKSKRAIIVKVEAYEVLVQPCHYDTIKEVLAKSRSVSFVVDVVPRQNGYCQLVFRYTSEMVNEFVNKMV